MEISELELENSLKNYLDARYFITLFSIRRKINKSKIDKESLRKIFLKLEKYGDYGKYKILYDLCLSFGFDNNKI